LYNQFGLAAVDLKWSNSLASNAKAYAEFLLDQQEYSSTTTLCNFALIVRHGADPSNDVGGENLAADSWPTPRTPEQVMKGWWDDERLYLGGHFTQAAWRASHYLGCGEASKDMGNGVTCNVQVCRYIKPGNCNGRSLLKVLADDSACGPHCPEEGCF
jgi:hypothetical protein